MERFNYINIVLCYATMMNSCKEGLFPQACDIKLFNFAVAPFPQLQNEVINLLSS